MSNEKKNDGGPAFPVTIQHVTDTGIWPEAIHGMTLRDYFAAKAMQAQIQTRHKSLVHLVRNALGMPFETLSATNESAAKCAYAYADAMLKAREK